MDEDIHENLKEVSKHLCDVGRMVGSTKTGLTDLINLRDILNQGAETLSIYIDIQKARYELV